MDCATVISHVRVIRQLIPVHVTTRSIIVHVIIYATAKYVVVTLVVITKAVHPIVVIVTLIGIVQHATTQFIVVDAIRQLIVAHAMICAMVMSHVHVIMYSISH